MEPFAVSIARTPTTPEDSTPLPLPWNEISRHLREQIFLNQDEIKRKEKAAERQRLYACGGDEAIAQMLCEVLDDPTVIEKRRDWVSFAKFNNVLRRIIGELSTCYAMPATRTVADPEGNERYQEVQRLCRQHEVMQRINRLLNLHRALVVMPRMRRTPAGEWLPVIDVVIPAKFSVVRDPLEPTLHLGIVFENDFSLAGSGRAPKWTMWTWAESIMFDDAGEALTGTHRPHKHGEIPALLVTLEPPDGKMIDSDTGDDLVAAQKSVWFLNILHLKEAKSATKQHVISGDITRAARNQAADTDVPIEAGDGASISTIDNSMDLSMFIASARHVYETAAANYGLSSTLLHQQGVQSADARELMRVPLRELRLQQQVPLRDFERALARLLARVVAERRPDLAFSLDGWRIDFADPQTPLGTMEALMVLEKELQLGMTSEPAEMLRRNPDLESIDAALSVLLRFAKDRGLVLEGKRDFIKLSGGLAQGSMPPEARSPDGSISSDQLEAA